MEHPRKGMLASVFGALSIRQCTSVGNVRMVLSLNAAAFVFVSLKTFFTERTMLELLLGVGRQRHLLGSFFDWILLWLFGINICIIVASLLHRLWICCALVPVALTDEQKKLLGIPEDDLRFQSPSESTSPSKPPPASPYASADLSWLFHITPKRLRSPGSTTVGSASGTSYSFQGSWPTSPVDSQVAASSPYAEKFLPGRIDYSAMSPTRSTETLESVRHRGGFVIDGDQTASSTFSRKLDYAECSPSEQSPRSTFAWGTSQKRQMPSINQSSTMSFPTPSKSIDFSSLAQYQYQPGRSITIDSVTDQSGGAASRTTRTPTSKSTGITTSTSIGSDAVWTRYGVKNTEIIESQCQRLRLWISETILKPIVEEISSLNSKVAKTATTNLAADFIIGESSLLHLQYVAVSKFNLYPTLGALLPYLELSTNQGYLVQRLVDLGQRDSCLKEFQWNGGSSYKGKPWDDRLPTDSDLIMHLFTTYMNSVSSLHPFYSEGKAFSSQYFLQHPAKPPAERKCGFLLIYQNTTSPPNYQLIVGDETVETEKGKNNLFSTLLLFFHHLKSTCGGRLGSVSLGEKGLNIEWVLE